MPPPTGAAAATCDVPNPSTHRWWAEARGLTRRRCGASWGSGCEPRWASYRSAAGPQSSCLTSKDIRMPRSPGFWEFRKERCDRKCFTGVAAAAAAFIAGLLFGRGTLTPAPASIDAAMASVEGTGLAALVTAQDPPDASVVFASLVEQH